MGAILLRDVTVGDQRKDILIGQGRIRRIGPAGSCADWQIAGDVEMMDCSGKVAIPGFVNMHTHSPMSLMRGIGEDMLFHAWLDKIWKVEEHLDHDFVYWGTKVACLEMIRTGTTTFNDQYWFFDSSVQAAREMGLRIATGYDVMDKGSTAEAERQKEQCIAKSEAFLGAGDSGHIYELAFHAIYSVSEEMIRWTADLAEKYDVNLHIHLSETRKEVEDCKAAHGGLSPVEYLDSLGVLSPRLLAAHTLWLSPHDIELLAARGVHCIHNINSNTCLTPFLGLDGFQDGPDGLFLGIADKAAGIDQQNIYRLVGVHDGESICRQLCQQMLRVHGVLRTAERDDPKPPAHPKPAPLP